LRRNGANGLAAEWSQFIGGLIEHSRFRRSRSRTPVIAFASRIFTWRERDGQQELRDVSIPPDYSATAAGRVRPGDSSCGAGRLCSAVSSIAGSIAPQAGQGVRCARILAISEGSSIARMAKRPPQCEQFVAVTHMDRRRARPHVPQDGLPRGRAGTLSTHGSTTVSRRHARAIAAT
jgi:hypothetical protein